MGDQDGKHEAPADARDAVLGVSASFGRDVAVNIVGNLLTAAVLYLAAVAVGVVPRNLPLIVLALGTVLVLTVGFDFEWRRYRGIPGNYSWWPDVALLGGVALFVPIIALAHLPVWMQVINAGLFPVAIRFVLVRVKIRRLLREIKLLKSRLDHGENGEDNR